MTKSQKKIKADEPKINGESVSIAKIAVNIEYIKRDIQDIKHRLEVDYITKTEFDPVKKNYVQRSEFDPVKKAVFGLIALIISFVIGAILTVNLNGYKLLD